MQDCHEEGSAESGYNIPVKLQVETLNPPPFVKLRDGFILYSIVARIVEVKMTINKEDLKIRKYQSYHSLLNTKIEHTINIIICIALLFPKLLFNIVQMNPCGWMNSVSIVWCYVFTQNAPILQNKVIFYISFERPIGLFALAPEVYALFSGSRFLLPSSFSNTAIVSATSF